MLEDHTLTHPITGEKISLPTREIVVDTHVRDRAADDLLRLGIDKRVAMVADPQTYETLGQHLQAALGQKFHVENVIFPDTPEPTLHAVADVRRATARADALLAVGSGTISDICKHAAFLEKKPYIAYATALSMNGYTSGNASILVDGYRQSMPAQPPIGIYVDLGVVSEAPARLTLSGLGDSLARATAQVDWKLSNLLLKTPYDPLPFELLLPYEKELFECCEGLTRKDFHSLTLLAKLLMFSGIGMWFAKGSYPASQGEHMIAHTMELKHPHACEALFHGEMIGVTTLSMAALQEELLSKTPIVRPCENVDQQIHSYFGERGGEFVKDYQKKEASLPDLDTLNVRIAEAWPEMNEFARRYGLSRSALESLLKRAGAPRAADALGWPDECYRAAIAHAHLTRNRFTFLDLAY